MRLSGERYVRLRVVPLSLRLSRAAAEVRSAVPRGRRASRTTSSSTSQGEAGCSGLSVLPAPRRHFRPSPRGVRLAHSPRSPESVHLVPNRWSTDHSTIFLKARFLSVRRAFFGSVFKVSKHT